MWNDSWRNASPRVRAGQLAIVSRWRASDSFALLECLGLMLPDALPDSTISRTCRLIDLETYQAVFTWMLQRLADAGLVKGKTVGIDATTHDGAAVAVGSPGQRRQPMSGTT